MQQSAVALTTRVGLKGAFDVHLPLNPATLNESLYDIGIWLIERHIPHQARIFWEPLQKRIRVRFSDPHDAGAFRKRFGATLQ